MLSCVFDQKTRVHLMRSDDTDHLLSMVSEVYNRTGPLFMVSAVYSNTKIHRTGNLCSQLIVVNLQDEDVLWVKAL